MTLVCETKPKSQATEVSKYREWSRRVALGQPMHGVHIIPCSPNVIVHLASDVYALRS